MKVEHAKKLLAEQARRRAFTTCMFMQVTAFVCGTPWLGVAGLALLGLAYVVTWE